MGRWLGGSVQMTGRVVFVRRVCGAVADPALRSLAPTNGSRSIIRCSQNRRSREVGISAPRREFASTSRVSARSEKSSRDGQQEPRRTGSTVRITASLVAAWLALNVGLELTGLDNWLARLRTGKPLNEKRFVPFVVASREQESPTAFVLTIKPKFAIDSPETSPSGRLLSALFPRLQFPHTSHTNRTILEKAWNHGLWSVEIKQPQIQVARAYTPLPAPSHEGEQNDLDSGHLRFLIRRMDGGEVSTYLSRLQVGDTVELRGPHLGFDVRARLGDSGKVVFLAGGTGIAPALQAARAILGTEANTHPANPSVSIIWANRHRADCPGIPSPRGALTSEISPPLGNAITSLLKQMKARYGHSLRYTSTVDDENTYITPRDILSAVGSSPSPSPSTQPGWALPFISKRPPSPPPLTSDHPETTTAATCKYHSPSGSSALLAATSPSCYPITAIAATPKVYSSLARARTS